MTGGDEDNTIGSVGPEVRVCETTEVVLKPDYRRNVDGQITYAHWADEDTLLFGTSYGYIHIFMRNENVSVAPLIDKTTVLMLT